MFISNILKLNRYICRSNFTKCTASRTYCTQSKIHSETTEANVVDSTKFETVFRFPFIKYLAIFNRLKVFHFGGTLLALPCSGMLELLTIMPTGSFLSTAYMAATTGALFSLFSIPFVNIIGFLYISEDNESIKIAFVDFWGRRIDRIIPTEDWIPMLELPSSNKDFIYLSPRLKDGTKFKLLIKFGEVLNSKKMGQVLE